MTTKLKVTTASICALFIAVGTTVSIAKGDEQTTESFPYVMPKEKPTIELSPAMNRVYDHFHAATPQDNELYTRFRYSALDGFDYNDGDGTISRRDPSRIVKVNGKYYVWYTKRDTESTYLGGHRAAEATETIPSTDWDLCDIFYATSSDGFTWEEQGVAVPRPPKPEPGWRSVSTPDVLKYRDKYYLYYQVFLQVSGLRGDDCPVAMSWSESPDGPWTPTNKVVVENGEEGSWDQYSIHDPQPIVFEGKIYLYYKSDYNDQDGIIRSTGLAISDSPEGPFKKYELNPVMSSGHETQLFRFREGIAAILSKDGHEANTIQYSPDGKNFEMAAISDVMPCAGALYDPDAFSDTKYAEGVTWGLSQISIWGPKSHTLMLRFDCDLKEGYNDPLLKRNIGDAYSYQDLLSRGLNKNQRDKAIKAAEEDLKR